jgi:hypothetical protein
MSTTTILYVIIAIVMADYLLQRLRAMSMT